MKKFWRIALPLLTLAVLLFVFSNASASSKKSSQVTKVVVQTIEKVVKRPISQQKTESIIRKLAHASEFGLLAFLLSLSVFVRRGEILHSRYEIFFSVLFCALTDEFLQTFSKGRYPAVVDVMIDFSGALAGFGAVVVLTALFRIRKTARERKKA